MQATGLQQTNQSQNYLQDTINRQSQPLNLVSPQKTGPKLEDITPEEEDLILQFITIISQIQSGKRKVSDAVYDQELQSLSIEVNVLRSKLNKALKNVGERHEAFLQLYNKLSAITKLYDQFIDRQFSSWGNNMNFTSQSPTVNKVEPQHTPYPRNNPLPSDPHAQQQRRQSRGSRNSQDTQGIQVTGYENVYPASQDQAINDPSKNSPVSQMSGANNYGNAFPPNHGFMANTPVSQHQTQAHVPLQQSPQSHMHQQNPSLAPLAIPPYPKSSPVQAQYSGTPQNENRADYSTVYQQPDNTSFSLSNVYPSGNAIPLPHPQSATFGEGDNAFASSPSPKTPVTRNDTGYPMNEEVELSPYEVYQNASVPAEIPPSVPYNNPPEAPYNNSPEAAKEHQTVPYPTLFPTSQTNLFSGQIPVSAQPSGGTYSESLEKTSSRFPTLETVERDYEERAKQTPSRVDSYDGSVLTRTSSHKSRYEPEPLIDL